MENKIEMAVVPEKEYKVVSDASISRRLLKDGYKLIDIKPKKGHERETVFIFKVEDGFAGAFDKYIAEKKERREKKNTELSN